jgi:hypothetical protein
MYPYQRDPKTAREEALKNRESVEAKLDDYYYNAAMKEIDDAIKGGDLHANYIMLTEAVHERLTKEGWQVSPIRNATGKTPAGRKMFVCSVQW